MDVATMREFAEAGFQKLGFIQYAGIHGVEQTDGHNVVRMTAKPEHVNHNGDLHAAVLFGIAETAAMGAAVSGVLDLIASTYIVARGGSIEYTARAKGANGPFTGTSDIPADVYAAARAGVEAGEPVEMSVPYSITDAHDTQVAKGAFTAVIRPRR